MTRLHRAARLMVWLLAGMAMGVALLLHARRLTIEVQTAPDDLGICWECNIGPCGLIIDRANP